MTWPVMGQNNTMNAFGRGGRLEMSFEDIAAAWPGSKASADAWKRGGGRDRVVDDYGIIPRRFAPLSALRQRWPERRLVTLFQPHRYSRTWAGAPTSPPCFDGTDCSGLAGTRCRRRNAIPASRAMPGRQTGASARAALATHHR